MKIKNIIFCHTFFIVVICIILCSCSNHSTIVETKKLMKYGKTVFRYDVMGKGYG